MTTELPNMVWPTLLYDDAPAAIRFLVDVLGFEESLVIRNDDDAGIIEHAQLLWPEGGGVMLGSRGRDTPFAKRAQLGTSVYVVTDDPDGVAARARSAGAEFFAELNDTDYGSRDVAILDPEGNLWNFGTYRGEARPE